MAPLQSTAGGWAIEATGLVKRFGTVTAVDGLDLRVPEGSVYGLLGPNGAGKTTTIRMLATLVPLDRGAARVLGHDVARDGDAVRSRISLTGQFASVDEDLTGHDNLVLLGRLLGHRPAAARRRAGDLLDAFDLAAAAHRVVKHYSGGMRRRLDVAASIVVTPDLLFLDEPTTGLDPRSRNQVWEIVRTLVAAGTTVVLTTQYLDEADALAEHIAVVDHGRVIADGPTAELKASVGRGALQVRLHDPAERGRATELLARTLATEITHGPDPTDLSGRTDGAGQAAVALGELARAGVGIADFSLDRPSLDEVFLTFTGHTAAPHDDEEVPA